MTTTTYPGTTYVIPCSGPKTAHAAPARDLYTGPVFRGALAAAEAAAADTITGDGQARVLVLSARHGLITLDTITGPYDVAITDPGAVTADQVRAQAGQLGIAWDGGEVCALLPRPYLARLDAALRPLDVYAQDVYEATAGIGEQRHANRVITATTGPAPWNITAAE